MSTGVIVAIAVAITAVVTMLITKLVCRREYRCELEDELYDASHKYNMELDKLKFENGMLRDTLEYRTQKLRDSLEKANRRVGVLSAELENERRKLRRIQDNHPEINVSREVYEIEHPHL